MLGISVQGLRLRSRTAVCPETPVIEFAGLTMMRLFGVKSGLITSVPDQAGGFSGVGKRGNPKLPMSGMATRPS